jgi:hypothetical protein
VNATIVFPRRLAGRQTEAAKDKYEAEKEAFCAALIKLKSTLDFDPGSRGWAYIIEDHGAITKGEFDAAQGRINDYRKDGSLPLDFCQSDEKRAFEDAPQRYRAKLVGPREEVSDEVWRLLLEID